MSCNPRPPRCGPEEKTSVRPSRDRLGARSAPRKFTGGPRLRGADHGSCTLRGGDTPGAAGAPAGPTPPGRVDQKDTSPPSAPSLGAPSKEVGAPNPSTRTAAPRVSPSRVTDA